MKFYKKPVEKMSLEEFVRKYLCVEGQDYEFVANQILVELYSHRWDLVLVERKEDILMLCILNNIQISPMARYCADWSQLQERAEELVGYFEECPEIVRGWDELKIEWEKLKDEIEISPSQRIQSILKERRQVPNQ